MKTIIKAIAIGLMIFVVFELSGCFSTLSGNSDSKKSFSTTKSRTASSGRNLTIKVKEFDIKGREDQIKKAQEVLVSPSFATSCATFEGLYKNSTQIVRCDIQNVGFTVKNGMPYTKLDVKVTDSLKGDLHIDDIITIIQYGGYMTIQDEIEAFNNEVHFAGMTKEERENTIIEKKITKEAYPKAGESYVYFLSLNNKFSGAYVPVNDYECRYKLNSKGRFVRYMPQNESNAKAFTSDEIQSVDNCTFEWMKQQIQYIASKR
ncbi:MAG: hypothetical protein QME45_14555 [Clostridiales bacterium]|nr:hypothetical protein [Clostridiales bacterium]